MAERPSYLREAATLPLHQAFVLCGGVAILVGLWRGLFWPLPVVVGLEVLYLLVVPQLPAFRRRCDVEWAQEQARQHALELERVAARLSPIARSRLEGLRRLQGRILDAMKTLPGSAALEQEWAPRLRALMNAALRILVSVDGTRADDRDERSLRADLEELESEVAKLSDGPLKDAKAQRLVLTRKRLGDLGRIREQREAALVQLDTLEDTLQHLLTQGLAARDAAAFGEQLEGLAAQVEAAGETVTALDRFAGTEAELASLRASRSGEKLA